MVLSGLPRLFIISLALVALCSSHHRLTRVNKRCDNADGGTINYVEVTGCNVEPCQVHPGTQYSITVNFTAKTQITSARNVLHGLFPVLGSQLKIAFPVKPDDNCGHGLTCPIQAGETVAYNVTLSYTAQDVPISLKIGSKWELQGANGTQILCFVIPLSVNSS